MKHESYSSGVDCRLQPWLVANAEPLPPRTRRLIAIDGPRWAEIDPDTGEILDEGQTHDDTSHAETASETGDVLDH